MKLENNPLLNVAVAMLVLMIIVAGWTYDIGHDRGKRVGYDVGVHASNVKCVQRMKNQRRRFNRASKRTKRRRHQRQQQNQVSPEAMILDHVLKKL